MQHMRRHGNKHGEQVSNMEHNNKYNMHVHVHVHVTSLPHVLTMTNVGEVLGRGGGDRLNHQPPKKLILGLT